MAKTNKYGYFCDVPCGFSNEKCQIFFCAGCASAGMKLAPNTEYPEYTIKHNDENKQSDMK